MLQVVLLLALKASTEALLFMENTQDAQQSVEIRKLRNKYEALDAELADVDKELDVRILEANQKKARYTAEMEATLTELENRKSALIRKQDAIRRKANKLQQKLEKQGVHVQASSQSPAERPEAAAERARARVHYNGAITQEERIENRQKRVSELRAAEGVQVGIRPHKGLAASMMSLDAKSRSERGDKTAEAISKRRAKKASRAALNEKLSSNAEQGTSEHSPTIRNNLDEVVLDSSMPGLAEKAKETAKSSGKIVRQAKGGMHKQRQSVVAAAA